MAIQKLNKIVRPGEKARASDFNDTTSKVDEIIDALAQEEGKNALFRGYTTLADAASLNDAANLGVYFLLDGKTSGTLTIARDSMYNISQIIVSASTFSYSDDGNLILSNIPSVARRTYLNGAWTRWETVGGDIDLTGYYKCVPMEQSELEDLRAVDCQEGVLYLGLGEVIDSETAWRFGGQFPIRFL